MLDWPSESPWLYGIHDAGAEQVMLEAGKPGWVVCSAVIGHDPQDHSGLDFRRYPLHRLGIICCLNNGPFPHGAIPAARHYPEFARRCANFVAASPGCHIWIVGDEPNRARRRPHVEGAPAVDAGRARSRGLWNVVASIWRGRGGADAAGEVITPQLYADCFAQCRTAIRQMAGHERDHVLVAAVAPWHDDTRYAGNEWGDWVLYFRDVLVALGAGGCDGFALHCHTHHADPRLIGSSATLGAPFAGRHYEFRVYRDFLDAVPQAMRGLPAFITEANQSVAWPERNTGWVRTAYDEIAGWNRAAGGPVIRALILHRWSGAQAQRIEDKTGTVEDFRLALRGDHRWAIAQAEDWAAGDKLVTLTSTPLCAAPGDCASWAGQATGEVAAFSLLEVAKARPVRASGLVWWEVCETGTWDDLRQGWLPQQGPNEERLLAALKIVRSIDPAGNDGGPIRPGDTVRTLDWARMRLTPGTAGKPAEDVVMDVAPDTLLAVVGGPKAADGLTWWLLRAQSGPDSDAVGWMAEAAPDGLRLLQREDAPPAGPLFQPGDQAETLAYVRLRRAPGYVDKPADDVLADLWQGTALAIVQGPRAADGLSWWEASATLDNGAKARGWLAERSPEGLPLLGKRSAEPPPHFALGALATVGPIPVRVRSTPGYVDKPDNDVLGEFRQRTTLVIQGGPEQGDALTWWRAGGIGTGGELIGWVAQSTPGGVLLVGKPAPLPSTDIPNAQTGAFLGMPFAELYGIGQLWGEHPDFYRRFSYDGVPLLGHNGIDFLTPADTALLAVEAGMALAIGYEEGGLGHYVLLAHTWGESLYAHLGRVDVAFGQRLRRGDPIGRSGSSGGSTGPHLHFAIRIHPYDRMDGWGGYADPLPYLNPERVIVPDYILDEALRIAPAVDGVEPARLQPSPMIDDQPGLIRP